MGNLNGIFDMIDDETGVKEEEVPEVKEEEIIIRTKNPECEQPEFMSFKPKDPESNEDPFLSVIESVLAESGPEWELESRRIHKAQDTDATKHEWSMGRDATYSGEAFQFRCKKCFKWLEVGRDQTILEALEISGVDPSCIRVIVQEVSQA
jgi:hypothetical protein